MKGAEDVDALPEAGSPQAMVRGCVGGESYGKNIPPAKRITRQVQTTVTLVFH